MQGCGKTFECVGFMMLVEYEVEMVGRTSGMRKSYAMRDSFDLPGERVEQEE